MDGNQLTALMLLSVAAILVAAVVRAFWTNYGLYVMDRLGLYKPKPGPEPEPEAEPKSNWLSRTAEKAMASKEDVRVLSEDRLRLMFVACRESKDNPLGYEPVRLPGPPRPLSSRRVVFADADVARYAMAAVGNSCVFLDTDSSGNVTGEHAVPITQIILLPAADVANDFAGLFMTCGALCFETREDVDRYRADRSTAFSVHLGFAVAPMTRENSKKKRTQLPDLSKAIRVTLEDVPTAS